MQYGGDLKKLTYGMKENTKDIAVRRGKSSIVAMIEEYCKFGSGEGSKLCSVYS